MTKWLVSYSSNTNNTKQVAEAIFSAAGEGSMLIASKMFAGAEGYDLVAVGFWVTRGGPDPVTRALLPKIRHKQVVLFQTLGAKPESEHAVTSLARAAYLLGEGCEIVGTFSSRGKISPVLLERRKALPPQNPHAYNEANIRRWEAAAEHPNAADKEAAKSFALAIGRKLARKAVYEQKEKARRAEADL